MFEEITCALRGKVISHMNKFGHLENHHVKIFVSNSVLKDLRNEIKPMFHDQFESCVSTLHGYELIEMKKDGYLIMIDSGSV